MRCRDPRRLFSRARPRATVRIVALPESAAPADGSVTTRQRARLTLPRSELERLWTAEHLERLASTYWRFLSRVTLGLLRVRYNDAGRQLVLIGRPLVLLAFRAPEYRADGHRASVTWPIHDGLLVAPAGRDRGYLRLTVERPAGGGEPAEVVTVTVTSDVAHFYPLLAGWGWFARIGRHIYRATQLPVHVVVTHAFLRSLGRLELAPSRVGALRRNGRAG